MNRMTGAMQFENPFRDPTAEETEEPQPGEYEDHFAFMDEWAHFNNSGAGSSKKQA